jgi:hypothetical protein
MNHSPDIEEDNALDMLDLAWGEHYVISVVSDDGKPGEWFAHRIGAPDAEVLRAGTPDALNRAIRDDWQHRQGIPPQRGPSGMPPS